MKITYAPGATPLDPDDIAGLIPHHITTQGELNEWEANNILAAENWLANTTHHDLLSIDFARLLHKKMFANTWRWAGILRTREKNIGIAPYFISTELNNLFADVAYQIKHESYIIDEIAYRFHHRLVWIHLFPNGNGRHARLMTDLLLIHEKQPRFTWGKQTFASEIIMRKQYIQALKTADKKDYSYLATFVRS